MPRRPDAEYRRRIDRPAIRRAEARLQTLARSPNAARSRAERSRDRRRGSNRGPFAAANRRARRKPAIREWRRRPGLLRRQNHLAATRAYTAAAIGRSEPAKQVFGACQLLHESEFRVVLSIASRKWTERVACFWCRAWADWRA